MNTNKDDFYLSNFNSMFWNLANDGIIIRDYERMKDDFHLPIYLQNYIRDKLPTQILECFSENEKLRKENREYKELIEKRLENIEFLLSKNKWYSVSKSRQTKKREMLNRRRRIRRMNSKR